MIGFEQLDDETVIPCKLLMRRVEDETPSKVGLAMNELKKGSETCNLNYSRNGHDRSCASAIGFE